MDEALARLRREYCLEQLDESCAPADPLQLFREWLDAALRAQLTEPNAMTLATVGPDGRPSARLVLLKDLGPAGLSFATNYRSRKGRELAANPAAALVFWWAELERQVRIEGRAAIAPAEESDAYFRLRPRAAQLGAWASEQSDVLTGGAAELVDRVAALALEYHGREVPRPPHWGLYRLTPEQFEFWQGRPNRLHDRLRYTRTPDGWLRERLSP